MDSYQVAEERIDYNRIFMLSDIHFGVRSNSIEWLENQLNFFYNFYIPFLKDNAVKGDILFILGDWFDNRQLLDINVLNKSIDLVIELSGILPVYFMVGNHDIYKKNDTDVNSIAPFSLIRNVRIFADPIVLTNGDSKILVIPWVGSKEKEENFALSNKADYIFAHTDIQDLKYDNGQNIKTGTSFRKIKVKKIFSGHIHKRQHQKNVVYIGSPYSTKRSDIGNSKGVYIFNPKEGKEEFYPNPISPIFQRIPLEDLLEMTLDESFSLLDNNYTDIIVPDKYIHLFNLTRFIDILSGCRYKKIETRGDSTKMELVSSEIIDGSGIKDIMTLLENTIDDLEFNTEFLINLKIINKEYYDKAKQSKIEQEYM